jgi:hypothetical protein
MGTSGGSALRAEGSVAQEQRRIKAKTMPALLNVKGFFMDFRF